MKKQFFVSFLFTGIVSSICFAQKHPYQNASLPVEKRAKDLVKRMTLEEKVAELNLIPYYDNQDSVCRAKIRAGKVGAFLKANGAALNHSLQKEALSHSRLGIPLIFHEDVIHGYYTIFPIPLAESCSWNADLVERSAVMAAREASAAGIQLTYAPMVDISHDARWGRIMETSGEDTYLGAVLSAARVRGFQGTDLKDKTTLAACVKHFAGYGAVAAGRDYQETDVSYRALQERYLPPFQAAIDAGVASVMCAYTSYDGEPSTMNRVMNEDILRKQMGFKGLLMTDWTTFNHAVTEGAAADGKEAAERGIQSGIDMDMSAQQFSAHLLKLVKEKRVPEALVDRAATRALELKFKMGLFDQPYAYFDTQREKETLYSKEIQDVAYEMACESMVLLKNEAVLPLASDKKIALVGPFATARYDLLGSWSMKGDPEKVITVEQGMKLIAGERTVAVKGCDLDKVSKEYIAEAVALARQCDVIVACLGESSQLSGEAVSTAKIELSVEQISLLESLKSTGKKVVVVLFNGRPLVLANVLKSCDALLEAWYPGTMGGKAVAALLTGIKNPSGKLSQTFPHHVGQIPLTYNPRRTFHNVWHADIPVGAQFPFGFGLSYTQYSYNAPQTNKKEYTSCDSVLVSVKVRNTGQVAGREVVQLYLRDEVSSVIPREKELKAFASVLLMPGEEKEVQFTLPPSAFKVWNAQMKKVLEPGTFKVLVGPDSATLKETEIRIGV